MYVNPLNNGKLSDYNSLKNQQDYTVIIDKYAKKKLEILPTELQKYYQYLTLQQSILDELNYVAERMRTEDIKTKTDDYNFIEELKNKREQELQAIYKNSNLSILKNDLGFSDDITPTIITDIELEKPIEKEIEKEKKKRGRKKKNILRNEEQLNNIQEEANKIYNEMIDDKNKEKSAIKIQNAFRNKKAINEFATKYADKIENETLLSIANTENKEEKKIKTKTKRNSKKEKNRTLNLIL